MDGITWATDDILKPMNQLFSRPLYIKANRFPYVLNHFNWISQYSSEITLPERWLILCLLGEAIVLSCAVKTTLQIAMKVFLDMPNISIWRLWGEKITLNNVECLTRKKLRFLKEGILPSELTVDSRLQQWLLPGCPAISQLHQFQTCCLHNCMTQFLKISLSLYVYIPLYY